MEKKKTNRGFELGEFKDYYGNECSIQKSSLATEDAIWIGINDPDPKVLASKASSFGIATDETTGWVEFPIPDDVLINTRMHLSREQVANLIPVLQRFVDTGILF
jgi:hypothetical protein